MVLDLQETDQYYTLQQNGQEEPMEDWGVNKVYFEKIIVIDCMGWER